jgi:DNA-binding response OmpR family regulator
MGRYLALFFSYGSDRLPRGGTTARMSERDHPTTVDAGIDTALAAMRQRYVESSGGFFATLELIGRQLERKPDSQDLLTSLRRELHRVRGTAGSLGFHDAGHMAGAMEGLIRRWCDDVVLDREHRSAVVLGFARTLRATIVTVPDAGGAPTRRVLLMMLPDSVADRLVAEGSQRGFAVERIDALATAPRSPSTAPWGMVAMEGAAELVAHGFPDAARVLLHNERVADAVPRVSATNVVDVATSAAEIIDLLERINGHRGGTGETVLLVDDDPMMLLLQRALAEEEGLSVETAMNGATFRDALNDVNPSLVVLDVEMPDADGITLLRELRADQRHRDVPVLMLSGRSDVEARTAAFGAGADDYMVKPIVAAEFQQRLLQLLALRRERRASTGLHPVSGLPMPQRTIQELEVRLRARGEVEWSIAVARPAAAPHRAHEIAGWQTECVRVAQAVRDAGGVAGMVDDSGLAMALPLTPHDAEIFLRATAGVQEAATSPWRAGVVGTSAIAAGMPRAYLSAASDAYHVAHERGGSVHVWDSADADIAPDVIVVEDDAALTEMIEFALNAKGLSHRAYANGPEALDALLRIRVGDRPPIVLLDIDLPGMDGHSLHERLRLERPGVFLVVFMSLHTGEADQLRALHGGALDYITKPISLRILMAKVAVWRERTRA